MTEELPPVEVAPQVAKAPPAQGNELRLAKYAPDTTPPKRVTEDGVEFALHTNGQLFISAGNAHAVLSPPAVAALKSLLA